MCRGDVGTGAQGTGALPPAKCALALSHRRIQVMPIHLDEVFAEVTGRSRTEIVDDVLFPRNDVGLCDGGRGCLRQVRLVRDLKDHIRVFRESRDNLARAGLLRVSGVAILGLSTAHTVVRPSAAYTIVRL